PETHRGHSAPEPGRQRSRKPRTREAWPSLPTRRHTFGCLFADSSGSALKLALCPVPCAPARYLPNNHRFDPFSTVIAHCYSAISEPVENPGIARVGLTTRGSR